MHYSQYNYGLGLDKKIEQIFRVVRQPNRVLPYERKFQAAVTYEIDTTKYEIVRVEFSVLDWLASVGGLSSIILAVLKVVSTLESPHRYVASALIA